MRPVAEAEVSVRLAPEQVEIILLITGACGGGGGRTGGALGRLFVNAFVPGPSGAGQK